MTKTGVSRFLSRREKKTKPIVKSDITKDIHHLFHCQEKKTLSRSEEKTLQTNIQELVKKLEALNITTFKESHIEYALRSVVSGGNADKAVELLQLFRDTITGEIKPIDPTITMLGAVNREMVTCYIDSLLFAMFARLDSFESILSVEWPDPATNTLAIIIRFWVNMLRTGRLITTDITKHLQESLGDCGWEGARRVAQQDVSEAFTFITDKLALPLLTLKMDVYHYGKEDLDDHRIVRERLLDVAIPEPPEDGSSVNLEDCLENYFNNKVEVKRHLQRRNTINSRPQPPSEKTEVGQVENIDLGTCKSIAKESLFRHRQIDHSGTADKTSRDDIDVHPGRKDTPRARVFRKEVLMPAWQFFHLIPWITPKSSADDQVATDSQVAAHFATKKPVLGICLKRYSVTQQGVKRLNTLIDIPLEIRLPHFIADGSEDDGWGSSFSLFVLSLQSVICHRGASIEAGHYVTLVRPSPNEQITVSELKDVEPKYRWILFDDLARDKRVKYVDVRKALKDEVPYLVFYQVQAIDYLGGDESPPSYAAATYAASTSTAATGTAALSNQANKSASTFVVNSPTSTPPTTVASTPLVQPLKNGPSIPPPSETDSLPPSQGNSHAPSLAALSQTSSQILGSEGIAIQDSVMLHSTMSCPPAIDDPANPKVRPHSLDLPIPASALRATARASQESERNVRFSVAFTDSTVPSAPITPYDEATTSDGYVGARTPGSSAASTPSAVVGVKKETKNGVSGISSSKRRGRAKDQDADQEKRDRRTSSRTWLSVTGSVRARTRPVSQPPNGETRRSIIGGEFFRGLRDSMSRDKLNVDVPEPSVPATTTAVKDTHDAKPNGITIPTTTTATAAAEKEPHEPAVKAEKTKDKSVSRRKSGRKGKARKEISPKGTKAESETPERQCALM